MNTHQRTHHAKAWQAIGDAAVRRLAQRPIAVIRTPTTRTPNAADR